MRCTDFLDSWKLLYAQRDRYANKQRQSIRLVCAMTRFQHRAEERAMKISKAKSSFVKDPGVDRCRRYAILIFTRLITRYFEQVPVSNSRGKTKQFFVFGT